MSRKNAFAVTILGNGSAVPTANRNLSAQMVQYGTNRFLVDCGEGTQLQMIRFHIKQTNLNNIFISHLHGEHFYGLFGLISTMHLYGRVKPLNIFAPMALKSLIEHVLLVSNTTLRFELIFFSLEDFSQSPLYETDQFRINAFPVVHRIPTWGFRFEEKSEKRKIDKMFIAQYQPDIETIKAIKAGNGFTTPDGEILSNDQITTAPAAARSYAFCADTAYDETFIEHLARTDLMYHEATFDNSMEKMAAEKYHATAQQAATLAKKAQVKKLLLGHFSARHTNLNILLDEAKAVFDQTEISEEGIRYLIE